MIGGKSSLLDVVDRDSGFYNSRYFDIRLSSDISKNRLFNECTLYCVFTEVDNISSYTERTKIEALFAEELKNSLGGYDMIFRLDDNKYAILMNIASDEKVFLELEKIRKAVSSKIHIIDGKEVSYTVSFAIMKYDDLSLSKQAYVKELDSLLELARSEGGNCVKI
jgi:GGDEF domain-containing protein